MGGFWEQLQFAFYSKQFGRKERLQFYESMSTLLENGVPLKDAVAEVHKIFAHEGQHPFHPVAIASREALMGLSNGKRLATAMALYLPAQERALIEAGEMSGNLVQAMGDAVSLVEAQARIRATIWQALLYPSALSAMMVFLLCIVAYRMVPSLARLSDPVTWTGPLATLNAIASFVTGPVSTFWSPSSPSRWWSSSRCRPTAGKAGSGWTGCCRPGPSTACSRAPPSC
ncbi:type II secretion system F family protein [Pseudomonas aeruginosa]|uniref:type II secretion system F family protein n=1 Tax=Pseudomonas aeruginosa TaxID=287 RepID=UPI0018AFE05F|nr:type II secretion system F family protein [Pseudomonas aeruginosa]